MGSWSYKNVTDFQQNRCFDNKRRNLRNCLVSDNFEESKCLACERGFYLNESSFTCESCDLKHEGCLECAQNYCFKCEPGYNLIGGKCVKDNFQLPYCVQRQDLKCIQCETNFINRDGQCVCDKSFTIDNNVCVLCKESIPGCVSCGQDRTCQQCDKGLYLSPDKTECTP